MRLRSLYYIKINFLVKEEVVSGETERLQVLMDRGVPAHGGNRWVSHSLT